MLGIHRPDADIRDWIRNKSGVESCV